MSAVRCVCHLWCDVDLCVASKRGLLCFYTKGSASRRHWAAVAGGGGHKTQRGSPFRSHVTTLLVPPWLNTARVLACTTALCIYICLFVPTVSIFYHGLFKHIHTSLISSLWSFAIRSKTLSLPLSTSNQATSSSLSSSPVLRSYHWPLLHYLRLPLVRLLSRSTVLPPVCVCAYSTYTFSTFLRVGLWIPRWKEYLEEFSKKTLFFSHPSRPAYFGNSSTVRGTKRELSLEATFISTVGESIHIREKQRESEDKASKR